MKKIVLAVFVAGISSAMYAQVMTTGGVDSVVVGSTMPYAVTPDANIASMTTLMDPSVFRWTVTDDVDNNLVAGPTTFTIAESPTGGLYAEDSINVTWNTPAGSVVKVKTVEVSQPKFGTSCDGNTSEQEVHVLAVPTVQFNGTAPFQTGSCNLTGDTISVDVSGVGPWTVTFSIEFDDNGSPVEHTETLGSIGMNGNHTLDLILDDVTHLTNGPGKYDVNFVNITDRISEKSLVDVSGNIVNPADEYVIGIYPTPSTGAIRHISN